MEEYQGDFRLQVTKGGRYIFTKINLENVLKNYYSDYRFYEHLTIKINDKNNLILKGYQLYPQTWHKHLDDEVYISKGEYHFSTNLLKIDKFNEFINEKDPINKNRIKETLNKEKCVTGFFKKQEAYCIYGSEFVMLMQDKGNKINQIISQPFKINL